MLITGASSGIGRAVAEHLNQEGYRVVLVARNQARLESVATELTDDSVVIPYDLTELEAIEQIFLQCKEENIKLYGLVHCAGINRDQPVRTNRLQDMIAVMNTNLLSFIELGKYFCRKKYSVDGASMVGISSTAVYACEKAMSTYSASKAGLDASVRVMSKEFAARGIRVNSIQPHFVDTDMARNTQDYLHKIEAMPFGVIKPMYVAYLVEYLLSEKAKYISGSNLKMSAAVV